MVKLYINNITQNAFSNADGDVVRVEIKKHYLLGLKLKCPLMVLQVSILHL